MLAAPRRQGGAARVLRGVRHAADETRCSLRRARSEWSRRAMSSRRRTISGSNCVPRGARARRAPTRRCGPPC